MKYAKPPLTLEQQADQLLPRGMVGDRDVMIARLRSVSYYRLSGYWFPFRNADDSFKPGTSFEAVWNRYVFDRRLRLLVMDAIERIEVAVRSQLAHHHSLHYRPIRLCHRPRHAAEAHGSRNIKTSLPISRRRQTEVTKHLPCTFGTNTAIATNIFPFGWRRKSWRSAAFLRSSTVPIAKRNDRLPMPSACRIPSSVHGCSRSTRSATFAPIADMAKPMFDHIDRNTEQSGTLAALRDALLPKLLSGEIRVGEAKQMVEENK